MDKELYGYLSIVLTIAAYAPYIWSTLKGRTKPHVFSWVIWSLLMGIATAGQFAGNAGPGWWASGLSALSCIIISVLSLRHGEKNITRHDVIIFLAALTAIPLWYATDSPLSAIILVSIIDVLGYLPTFRKAYAKPKEEMAMHYIISNLKHAASIFAMHSYSMTTVLYPATLFAANVLLVAVIYQRRAVLR